MHHFGSGGGGEGGFRDVMIPHMFSCKRFPAIHKARLVSEGLLRWLKTISCK